MMDTEREAIRLAGSAHTVITTARRWQPPGLWSPRPTFRCWRLCWRDGWGLRQSAAANVGLVVAVMLMIFYGWSAGRAARVDGKRLFVITSVAAALGLMMIVLKDVVLIHLH